MTDFIISGIQIFADGEAENTESASVRDEAVQETTAQAPEALPKDENKSSEKADDGEEKNINLNSLKAVEDTFAELKRSRLIKEQAEKWEREALELKETYPSFDFGKEIKNGEFERLLNAGVSLRKAYEAVNLESIISEAMRYATVLAGKKAAEALSRQAARPKENSVFDRASSLQHKDVASLTEKDIMRIISEVGKGAKITF